MPLTVTVALSPLTVPTTMSLIMPATSMTAWLVTKPSGGESMVTTGARVSKAASMVAVPMLPTWSVATAVITLLPSSRSMEADHWPPATATAAPFSARVAKGSSRLPDTVIGLVAKALPVSGAAIATTGSVTSSTMVRVTWSGCEEIPPPPPVVLRSLTVPMKTPSGKPSGAAMVMEML